MKLNLNLAVLIPIWCEERTNILKQNIEVFTNLKYPPKSKVFWLLHETDDKTPRKAGFVPFEVLLDGGLPPLKAKALNNAIKKVNAKVFAVFDVDAIPEADFLTKGYEELLTAHRTDERVICLQGARYPYSSKENWLSRRQEQEYAIVREEWIRCHGSGFMILGESLSGLGGYPISVTEDLALTRKMRAEGYVIRRFHGKYYEEVPSTLRNWIGQRARWKKGDPKGAITGALKMVFTHLLDFGAVRFIIHPTGTTKNVFLLCAFALYLLNILRFYRKYGLKDGLLRTFMHIPIIYAALKGAWESKSNPLRWFHTPKFGKKAGDKK